MRSLRGCDIRAVVKEIRFIFEGGEQFFLLRKLILNDLKRKEYLASQRGVRNYTPVLHIITACGLKT